MYTIHLDMKVVGTLSDLVIWNYNRRASYCPVIN